VQTTSSLSPTREAMTQQSWVSELVGALKHWWSAAKTWRLEQAAINKLSTLTNRQLNDIGFHRSEIIRAARDRITPNRTFRRYY
jgi:uncharacterized protein YjiS (DUF1127 family)